MLRGGPLLHLDAEEIRESPLYLSFIRVNTLTLDLTRLVFNRHIKPGKKPLTLIARIFGAWMLTGFLCLACQFSAIVSAFAYAVVIGGHSSCKQAWPWLGRCSG